MKTLLNFFVLLALVTFSSATLFAQEQEPEPEPEPATATEESQDPIAVKPWEYAPSPGLRSNRGEIPEIRGAVAEEDLTEEEVSFVYTSLHNLGVVLSYSNSGVTKGMYTVSDDAILRGKVSESVWGLGLLMDLGWSEDALSSLRTKWSWGRERVTIPQNIRDAYPADSLEESLNLFMMDFVMRAGLPGVDLGNPLWMGFGFSVHYALSSSTNGSGSGRQSRLKNSTSLSPILAVGSDIPLQEGHQLIVEADWLLFKGLQFSLGLRTRL